MKLYTISREITNPYDNLALESWLMQAVPENSCILYLWQNSPTVVIGRNQNVWSECRTSLLQTDGVFLARRYSGGGAVYHDLGNLNFTFVAKENCYDQQKQFAVILRACRSLGMNAELSGRNDLLAEGSKFSGNAFLHQGGAACHHGTLLINSDFTKLGNYLTPPKAKLQSKGVASVRSRVTNLKALCPELTVEKMAQALIWAFSEVYDGEVSPFPLPASVLPILREKAAKLSDEAWLYGNRNPFNYQVEDRFAWGCIRIQMLIEQGTVKTAEVFTDSLDWTIADTVQLALTGCCFQKEALKNALAEKLAGQVLNDITCLLEM